MSRQTKIPLGSTVLWICIIALFVSLSALAYPRTTSSVNSSAANTKKQAAAQSSATPPAVAQAASPHGGYVGADACKICHEDLFEGHEKSPHFKTSFDKHGILRIRDAKDATAPVRRTWTILAT
jgi:hypothetical protein